MPSRFIANWDLGFSNPPTKHPLLVDPGHPHTFRRRCTTKLLRGGANMYPVKQMLGHESLDTLKHYARLTITDLEKPVGGAIPGRRRDEGAG